VAVALALEFSLDFDRAFFEIKYDASKISDETNIEVYACHNWNLDARQCSTDWDRIGSEIDVNRNLVSFDLTKLSAFIVGERKGLGIEASLDKKEYHLNDAIKLTGVVRDTDNRFVEGVTVSYSIGSEKGKAETNSDGVFSATLAAPGEEGFHIMNLVASKAAYEGGGTDLEVSVLREKKLLWVLPLKSQINDMETSAVEVSLINSGQETLKDIRISVGGIPQGWYDFEPKEIEGMGPGKEEIIIIEVTPESPDRTSYTVNVEAECDEIGSESDNFVLTVSSDGVVEQPGAQEIADPGPGFSTDQISSYIVSNLPHIVNSISVAVSVAVIGLLGLRLRKKKGSDGKVRSGIMNLMTGIKMEISRNIQPGRKKKEEKQKAPS
jgi:hypothetical protein